MTEPIFFLPVFYTPFKVIEKIGFSLFSLIVKNSVHKYLSQFEFEIFVPKRSVWAVIEETNGIHCSQSVMGPTVKDT